VSERPDPRGERDVEIAYAVTTSAVPAVLLVVVAVAVRRWSGMDRSGVWPGLLLGWEIVVAAAAILRTVLLLARFDARHRSERRRGG
jgi:uncharacterized membrane protein YhaH (DUF805 family)